MAKKRAKKRVRATRLGSRLIVGILSLVALVVMAAGLYLHGLAPCANSGTCRAPLAERIENGAPGTFQGRSVPAPSIYPDQAATASVLGINEPGGEKHIYVDLSAQKLYAYEGGSKVFETLVSTGRWGKTPTGDFQIWSKLRSTRMSGGSGADYYDLPNVPFTMFFYHDFGLHGAYWHNNFGHTMSHGCVNLRKIDAEALFNWADGPEGGKKGTPVSVCDTFVGPATCVQNHPVN